jgi:hypothetical protein
MKKKQTAVDWLEQEYKEWYRKGNPIILKLIKQAKEMEKEQIKLSYNQGYRDAQIDGPEFNKQKNVADFIDSDIYYKETYGE